MAMCEPRWRRGGRCSEVGEDAVLCQQVEHPVEPAELVSAGLRLEEPPRKDADRDEVDAALVHEADVLEPDLLRPLLGVVVASVEDVRDLGDEGYAASLSDMFGGVKTSDGPRRRISPSA
jgi:hypothetical protein